MKKIFSILMIGLLLACASLISCSNGSSSDSGSSGGNGNSGNSGGNNNSQYYGIWKFTDGADVYKLEILTNTDCQLTLPTSIYPFPLPFAGTCSITSSSGITAFAAIFTVRENEIPNVPAGQIIVSGTFTNDTTLHINPITTLNTKAADFIKQQ